MCASCIVLAVTQPFVCLSCIVLACTRSDSTHMHGTNRVRSMQCTRRNESFRELTSYPRANLLRGSRKLSSRPARVHALLLEHDGLYRSLRWTLLKANQNSIEVLCFMITPGLMRSAPEKVGIYLVKCFARRSVIKPCNTAPLREYWLS